MLEGVSMNTWLQRLVNAVGARGSVDKAAKTGTGKSSRWARGELSTRVLDATLGAAAPAEAGGAAGEPR